MAYTVVYTPSKINFNFNKGEVSHIGIFYIDLSDNSIEFTKLDDEVIEDVTTISARLIANIASLKLRKNEIEELERKLEAAIQW